MILFFLDGNQGNERRGDVSLRVDGLEGLGGTEG